MSFNNLEAAKSELQSRGLNLPTEIENRELNEKELKSFNWYVVIDTSISTGGRSAKQIVHFSLQSFDVRRMVKKSVQDIINSGDCILLHDMNKKPEATKGRKKASTNENDEV